MKFSILSYCVTVAVTLSAWGAGTLAVRDAVARFTKGDQTVLCLPSYPEPSRAAVQFLEEAQQLPDRDKRLDLLQFAWALEQEQLRRAGPVSHSKNSRLGQLLVQFVCSDPGRYVHREAANALRGLFAPADLDSFAAQLAEAARRWKQPEIVILYGLLPSSDGAAVQVMAQELSGTSRRVSSLLRGVLARHGDKAAQQELLGQLRHADTQDGNDMRTLAEALGFIRTKEVQTALAGGLRLPDRIDHPGGGVTGRRDWYALALVEMMLDDPVFPVKKRIPEYSDEQLDQIESWCVKNLSVRFPDGPRPKYPFKSLEH